jgi:hypothetical protein
MPNEARILEICNDEDLSRTFCDVCIRFSVPEFIFLMAEPYFRAHPYENEAKNLCRMYIYNESERQLNIDPEVRQLVANRVEALTPDAVASAEVFSEAFQCTLDLLNDNLVTNPELAEALPQ